MSVLGRFAKLDSALQRGLDNSFALVFGGRVVPAEIDELLKQEAEDNIVRTYDDVIEAPNVYSVGVSGKDFRNLSEQSPELPDSFADQMARYCRNQGWTLAGPVVVTIGGDSGMRTGQLKVSSTSSPQPAGRSGFDDSELVASESSTGDEEDPGAAGTDWSADSDVPVSSDRNSGAVASGAAGLGAGAGAVAASAAGAPGTADPSAGADAGQSHEESENMSDSGNQEARSNAATEHMAAQSPDGAVTPDTGSGPTVSLLLQDGSSRTYLVHEGSNIIGRSNDVDFRLPDTGVSRQHAEVTWDGRDAVLVDLQSTNGTTVNDTPVENWLLADGDVITLGHSHIEVRITGR